MVSPIKVFIKFVCKLPFTITFYFYSLIRFFNFRTKIPLRSRKTAIAQTPPPPPPPENASIQKKLTEIKVFGDKYLALIHYSSILDEVSDLLKDAKISAYEKSFRDNANGHDDLDQIV